MEDEVAFQQAAAGVGEGFYGVFRQRLQALGGVAFGLVEKIVLHRLGGAEFAGEFEDFGIRLALGFECLGLFEQS